MPAPNPARYPFVRDWQDAVVAYLNAREQQTVNPKPVLVPTLQGGESATQPGIIMYDATAGKLVVSDGTTWQPIAMASEL
jgi:hypothetical protein